MIKETKINSVFYNEVINYLNQYCNQMTITEKISTNQLLDSI